MKYLCDPQVIPAVVPKSAGDIARIAEPYAAFAQWLHVDISDGKFTTDSNWPLEGFAKLPATTLSYEAHLMVQEPEAIGLALAKAGAKRLIAHREAFADEHALLTTVKKWRDAGVAEVGVALLIDTPLTEIDPLIDSIDFVQMMSIARVGHQGEEFDERVLSRVEEFHVAHPDVMVSVDGGITEARVEELVRAGANRLVVGHALIEHANPEEQYARIHERAMLGCKPQTLEFSI